METKELKISVPNDIEEWTDIKGYEGVYQVSNLGRIKRFSFFKNIRSNGKQYVEEHILKGRKRKDRYIVVGLCVNSVCKIHLVHRLVANAFIPNPQNFPHINHKDENKSNNKVCNLEWCNQKYNSNYGTSAQRISAKLTNGKRSKNVEQYDKDGTFIQSFPSASEAARVLNIPVSSIVRCCNNSPQYSIVAGYQWKYKNGTKNIKPINTYKDFTINKRKEVKKCV